jgi:N-acetyl sugar amidotransferase
MAYQICKRCVMDTSDPAITFNENGHCNHCTQYLEKTQKRSSINKQQIAKFNDVVASIKKKGKGRKYDCILGISGGADSCFTAHILKEAGLRVLAVHLDNGWDSSLAVDNINRMVKHLKFDYQSYVLDWELFRKIQIAFLEASVPEFETPTDIAILASLHEMAAKYNVKTIISGGNFATEGILPKHWHYDGKDVKYFKSITKTFGITNIKNFPLLPFYKEAYYKLIKGIKMVYILNYVNYNKKEVIEMLNNRYGWNSYPQKHGESIYTGFIQAYVLPKKFNIDYRRARLAAQICNGEVSREIALHILENPPYLEEKITTDFQYVAKKLNLSEEKLQQIIDKPGNYYTAFPNSEKLLQTIYNIYLKFFAKR